MGDMSGVDRAKNTETKISVVIVFLTSYKECREDIFLIQNCDYLLKLLDNGKIKVNEHMVT